MTRLIPRRTELTNQLSVKGLGNPFPDEEDQQMTNIDKPIEVIETGLNRQHTYKVHQRMLAPEEDASVGKRLCMYSDVYGNYSW